MGCGSSSNSNNSSDQQQPATKLTNVLPDDSDSSRRSRDKDKEQAWSGSGGGFGIMMHNKAESSFVKGSKHAGDYSVILGQPDQGFWVVEKGGIVGKFGNYRVGDIVEIKMAELRNVLRRLFVNFDLDSNGSIDADEVQQLLISVMSHADSEIEPFTKQETLQVLAALDRDQNGTVDEDEWVDWMLEGLCSNVEEREKALATDTQSMGRKLASVLEAVENIYLSGCYIEYSVNKELRYVSARVNRSDWGKCGLFSIMKGATDASVSIQWIASAKGEEKKSKARPIRWIEMEGVDSKNTWLKRYVPQSRPHARSAARSASASIKADIDATQIGISFAAGIPSAEKCGIVMCGLNNIESTALGAIFISKVDQ